MQGCRPLWCPDSKTTSLVTDRMRCGGSAQPLKPAASSSSIKMHQAFGFACCETSVHEQMRARNAISPSAFYRAVDLPAGFQDRSSLPSNSALLSLGRRRRLNRPRPLLRSRQRFELPSGFGCGGWDHWRHSCCTWPMVCFREQFLYLSISFRWRLKNWPPLLAVYRGYTRCDASAPARRPLP